ncbi:MAG: methyl-accepting chemotaxis protein [Neptuniibacter sp.]
MSLLISPATKLMGNIKYPAKFSLVSVLFLIPLVLTVVLYWGEVSRNIDLTREELKGIELIQLTEPLVVNIGQHRGLTNALLNGNSGVESKVLDRRAKVDKALSDLSAGAREASPELQNRISALGSSWGAIKSQIGSTNPAEIFEMHNRFAADVRSFNRAILTEYSLVLDQHIGTTFMIDNVAVLLPQIIDETGQLRGKAAGVAARGSFTADSFIYVSNLQSQLDSLYPLIAEGLGNPELGSMQDEIRAAHAGVKSYIAYTRNNVTDPDQIAVSSNEVFSEGTAAIKQVLGLYKTMLPALAEKQQEYLDGQLFSRNLIIAVILVTVTLAIYLFIGFYRSTMNTIHNFREVSERLSNGDLTVRLNYDGKDEMSAISDGMNGVAEGFEHLVREAKRATQLVSESSRRLSGESMQTRDGVARQKEETNYISGGVADLSTSASEIAQNTNMASGASQRVDQMATEGLEVVQKTTAAFNELVRDVSETGAVISELDNDVQNIHAVSKVISDIADQTNLLALNAAIEAARAGEQGRGFAVVADEVRTLAQRTQDSTGEIRETLSKLQDCASRAVKMMERTNTAVSENVEDMQQASDVLHEIDTALSEINQMNLGISAAAEQQSGLVQDLHQNLAAIGEVADTSERAAQNTSSLAEDMERSAAQLELSLSKFSVQ